MMLWKKKEIQKKIQKKKKKKKKKKMQSQRAKVTKYAGVNQRKRTRTKAGYTDDVMRKNDGEKSQAR